MAWLTNKKVLFYDKAHLKSGVGEVRMHRGNELLVLSSGKWFKIKKEDVKRVYDGS